MPNAAPSSRRFSTLRVAGSVAVAAFALALSFVGWFGCGGSGAGATCPGEIPITTASDEARRIYVEGRDLAEHMHTTDARRRFLRAVELDPGFARAQLELAMASPSIEDRRAALARALEHADAVSEGERLLILAADAAGRGAPAREAAHLERLVQLHPTDARAWTAMARSFFRRADYAGAIPHYEHAVEVDPGHGFAWNQLGYCYRHVGRADDAERAFLRYIELTPGEPNPLDSYAELLMSTGRHDASIAEYRKALAIDPAFVESYVGIGNNLIFLGRPADARLTFQQLLDVARDEGQRHTARKWIAATYLHEDNPGKALSAAREMVEIALAGGEHLTAAMDECFIGEVRLAADDPDGALESFERARELVRAAGLPGEMAGRYERRHIYYEGLVALHRGDLDAARTAAEAYRLAVTGDDYRDVALARELEGRVALAESDFEAAVCALKQANGDDPRVMLLLARALRGAGDVEGARELDQAVADYRGLDMNYAFVSAQARWLVAER